MRNPLADKVVGIKPSGIRKFFDIASEMKDAISLGVGEPDFDTPWQIREEGIYTLERGKTYYTANSGLMELRVEICNYLKRHYNLNYDPKTETLVTVGGSEAIDLAFRAMLNPGEEVIIPEPCYVSYLPCAVLADGVPVTIALQEKNNFCLTPEELENAITEKTKLLVLAFPNNPTGAVMNRKQLEEIAAVCIKHDIFVVSDEIYSSLNYGEERHVSIAEIEGMRERTIVINGFSKAHAMTGWRLGYACGPNQILQQMIKIHQFAIMCAPTNSQYAAVVALRDCDDEVAKMRDEYNGRRRFMLTKLRGMGLQVFEPLGAFYIFPNISEFGMTSDEFATRFLKEKNVAAVPGNAFGTCGEGFLRMSYATSLKNLKIAMERLEEFVTELRAEK